MVYLILGIIVLLIVGALLSSVRIRITYEDAVQTTLHFWCFRYRLYPKKEQSVKESDFSRRKLKRRMRRQGRKQRRASSTQTQAAPQAKKTPTQLLTLVRELYAAFRAIPPLFRKHLRVRVCYLCIAVGTADAAETALLTGAITEGVRAVEAFLKENIAYARKRNADFSVCPAYTADHSTAAVRVELHLRAWHAIVIGIKSLVCYLNYKNKKQNV